MRRQAYAVAMLVAASCFIAAPSADARRHAHRTQAVAQPTSPELLQGMLTAADEWWTMQGSPPPCVSRADVQWGQVGPYSEWAFYESCTIVLSPHWWATQYAFLTGRRSRTGRVRAAAYDLALIMHARGHNVGYRHMAGTVMQEYTPVVPGWAFEWAARTIR